MSDQWRPQHTGNPAVDEAFRVMGDQIYQLRALADQQTQQISDLTTRVHALENP